MDMLDRIDYWGRMYPTEAMLLALLSVVACLLALVAALI